MRLRPKSRKIGQSAAMVPNKSLQGQGVARNRGTPPLKIMVPETAA
ncbi:hypothetical protein HY3_14715 [Hyphomonas pacifica]|jgi:hypothetical protein|uniref:Uncharacterized protein n=1 Tax=Hyphomonas pacifica TaxID=1280941 RepID=A0A062U2K2_9PROT|nr:hypothetical protein HY2_14235 [Hyphomonas pacifica]RAN32672.1 hypothetical protein HY3_14715 [Hyphomonas pacifica]|tara:strand:+ start:945 stop:1082 length:138 start_codon:yes stop_codon:yes gene_type:complete